MKKPLILALPAILWSIICFVLLIIPGSAIPKENWLDKIWADKWVHIGMFALLVYLWCRVVSGANPGKEKLSRLFVIIAVLAVAYGIGMEFVQEYFVPNRSLDIRDMLADTTGSVIGFLYSHRKYFKK